MPGDVPSELSGGGAVALLTYTGWARTNKPIFSRPGYCVGHTVYEMQGHHPILGLKMFTGMLVFPSWS